MGVPLWVGAFRRVPPHQRHGGIEGIGFQFHYFSRKSLDGYIGGNRCDPGALLDTYEMFAKLGLPLWITEITIGSAGDNGLAIQGRVVRDIYRLWFASPKMAGITWWNLGDGTAHKWKGGTDENRWMAGLLNRNLNPKEAYRALDQLINHEWKTTAAGQTDAEGRFTFRGFYGHYAVTMKSGKTTKHFEIDLSRKRPKASPDNSPTRPTDSHAVTVKLVL